MRKLLSTIIIFLVVGCSAAKVQKAHDALDTAASVHDASVTLAALLCGVGIITHDQHAEVIGAAAAFQKAYLTAEAALNAYESARTMDNLTALVLALQGFYDAKAALLEFLEVLEGIRKDNGIPAPKSDATES